MKNKIVIYQTLPRLFGNKNTNCIYNGSIEQNGCGKFNDFDAKTLQRIRHMGFTHVWYTGIIRHALTNDYSQAGIPRQHPDVVKGKAGSPYAIADYYDVDPDLAVTVENRMGEWEALIERTHQAGMKVIIDFVPNHVARQYHSVAKPSHTKDLGEDDDTTMHFSIKNNFYYCWGQPLDLGGIRKGEAADLTPYEEMPAKATGNDHFDAHPGQNDWYETVKLNYGIDYCDAGGRSEHFSPIPDTWGKMTDILLFWAAKGVDGFRCDMAEMVPAAFWNWATDKVKFAHPEVIFIGEVYDPNQYRNYVGAGFDYLYDKVGMYDCLCDIIKGFRPAADITRQWQQTDDIRQHMLYFMENHDEVRLASDFLAGDAQKAFPAVAVSALLADNPMMVYAGQEFGERGMDCEGYSGRDGRTTIFDYWCVDSLRRGFFDRRRLTKPEKSLNSQYERLLRLVNSEAALREGVSFDLMYVNPQLAQSQFAFLRKAEQQLVLVVANFDRNACQCQVVMPQHAFDFMQLPEKQVVALDLFTDKQTDVCLERNTAIKVEVDGYGVALLKMDL